MNNNKLAVLNIQTDGIASILYNADGHYVNISDYSNIGKHWRVRITDSWKLGVGN